MALNKNQSVLLSMADFEYFRKELHQRSGIRLNDNKREFVQSRLMSRLNSIGMKDFSQYRQYLAQANSSASEWQIIINHLTTNKTEFFRETGHFRFLQDTFLAEWLKNPESKKRKLRVWSAASSSGEEAYSIAMLLRTALPATHSFEILATDIDTAVVEFGKNGVYNLNKLQEIPVVYHREYLVFGKGEVSQWFKIHHKLKQQLEFRPFNLVQDDFEQLGNFDLIFCRNVFLYFETDTITKICQKFQKRLNHDAYLILGHAESMSSPTKQWKSFGSSIYKSIPSPTNTESSPRQEPSAKDNKNTLSTRKKILIVDDSVTMRELLGQHISQHPALEVFGKVADPRDLPEILKKSLPDLITLDSKMPHMDGCEVLEKILSQYTIPTLVISALTKEEGPEVMRALELGATDYLEKPSFSELKSQSSVIIEKILQIAQSKPIVKALSTKSPQRKEKCKSRTSTHLQQELILIGASTGGIQALTAILSQLAEDIPPILIVQHIPAVFSLAFAQRLNQLCPFEVLEAKDRMSVQAKQVLIAPGGQHMEIKKDSVKGLIVSLSDAPPVNRHRPSVDVLFDSAAKLGVGSDCLAILLTGMGNDGAKGLLGLKHLGVHTIAQDEASSAVFGMPREAIRLKAATEVLALDKIAQAIESFYQKKPGLKSAI